MKTRTYGESSSTVGAICAITAAVVFSTGGLLVRQIDLPAWDVSFWRSALMIITILPLLIWRRREAWIDARNAGGALFASAIGIAGSMVAFILALGLAPVANVLIVFGATPFITALVARLVLGEPLHRHTLVRDGRCDRGPRDVGRGLAGGRRARRHGASPSSSCSA